MPFCKKCNDEFPNRVEIGGKIRVLNSRRFCLNCSPFGTNNRKDLTQNATKKTKICPSCSSEKTNDEFYKRRGDKLSSYCKSCSQNECRRRHRLFKQKCLDYKGGSCEHCGYNKFYGALEFHHIDPNEKDFTISKAKGLRFDEKITTELDKCVLLCSNCHKEEHGRILNDS